MTRFTLLARPEPRAFVCANCGADWLRHNAHGLCHSCYSYQWRNGRPRPVGPRPACQRCGGPRAKRDGYVCSACYAYRRRTGHDRPPQLWGRRLCAACRRGLSLRAPVFQTLCRSCSGRPQREGAA